MFWTWALTMGCSPVFTQQILNGSFETVQVQCGYNLSNEDFSDKMPDVVGFGEKNELDILQNQCNYGPAQSGRYFVALYGKEGLTDALGLRLSAPLDPQLTYKVEFYAKIGEIDDLASRLAVGVGTTATSHGELLYTTSDLYREWTRYEFQFKPPIAGAYLTVLIETAGGAWLFVDNFSLVCPRIGLGPDTTYCEVQNILLESKDEFDAYRWSDQSTGRSITVSQPGLYWMEGVTGGCTVRDTVRIAEDEFNCTCKVYLPTGFSPNDDGINDTWTPVSPCELMDYELLVFNRWGGVVFRSQNPAEGWNGRESPAGTYPYLLRYRVAHGDSGEMRATGAVNLIR
ncbi:MAG: gliding motility-associated C-terminal domain-containing protein [Lewinellaceae bacterium]|nr:gliding motility-associated C-terminal domain-containing protein [Lewinella sp.]MCB9277402.1 gliding motility-associated C-terminal domain-containing protein [Lewinellaceae bacterium]